MTCPIICLFYPKTQNFCVCGSLTAGIAMITTFYFIGSLVTAVYAASFHYGSDKMLYLLLFIVTVFLPIAALSGNHEFVLPWLVYVFCFVLLQIIECLLMLLLLVFGKLNFLKCLEELVLSAIFIVQDCHSPG
ncbi:uncharacterized protein LOC106666366 isoform X2 [Cimex lectularius]|uniref:Uncharacterized protein n=1 Tax=Cimex lectularius TaxID=79782 RepID=A0A8I6TH91_CIMLE|nr:uncharacterized protein LOC106666366 isoform X2 [Cimex lectularius]